MQISLRFEWLISVCIVIYLRTTAHAWHRPLTFAQQWYFETDVDSYIEDVSSISNQKIENMRFLTSYDSYAVYGARGELILLKPHLSNETREYSTYSWPVEQTVMNDCVQEWNTIEKCYNDVVHVRILNNKMDVYGTYAHRPMVRVFDLKTMKFTNKQHRDPDTPMDSDVSYSMVNVDNNLVTAGYHGDFIPTIRSNGKTLLYTIRQNSHFVNGFAYDGKAVFGVIETSERAETNRVSRLVMACSNRAEIVRKATLNCSANTPDSNRIFVFHILTSMIDPVQMKNGSSILYTSFTTNNSTITASAICIFLLNQFYDVFTGPSMKSNLNSETVELIKNCSQSTTSTIDRETVESQKQFISYPVQPIVFQTMAEYIFTQLTVIVLNENRHCILIGTSDGRLFTLFVELNSFRTTTFEELILSHNMRYEIKSLTTHKANNGSYTVIVTNRIGYVFVKLIPCKNGIFLCFYCLSPDCQIKDFTSKDSHCSSNNAKTFYYGANHPNNTINKDMNQTYSEIDNIKMRKTLDDRLSNNLLFYIVCPMSVVIFVLSISIIILLTKSTQNKRRRKAKNVAKSKVSNFTSNNVVYRIRKNNSVENHIFTKSTKQRSSSVKINHSNHSNMFLTKSEICVNNTKPLESSQNHLHNHYLSSYTTSNLYTTSTTSLPDNYDQLSSNIPYRYLSYVIKDDQVLSPQTLCRSYV